MFGSLITRPLRIATRTAQITLHGVHEAVEVAEGLVGILAGRVLGDDGHGPGEGATTSPEPAAWRGPAASSTSAPADAAAGPTRRAAAQASPPARRRPAARRRRAAAPPVNGGPGPGTATRRPAPAVEPELPHVSDEPELVEEVAEPGAEEGAGAQLRVAEPWEGYAAMKAADVIDRLAAASREELAAVELYELAHRKRKSVVAAARRALKRSSPPR